MSFGELPGRRAQLRKFRQVRYNAKGQALRRAMKGITGKREPRMRGRSGA